MNKVEQYLDGVFSKYTMTSEMSDLKEQLQSDCNQRLEDYMKDGMSQDEAADKVIDHLGDLEELLKTVASEGTKDLVCTQSEKNDNKQKRLHVKDEIIIDEEITSLKLELGSCDLNLIHALDDHIAIHTNCEFDKIIEDKQLVIKMKKINKEDNLLNFIMDRVSSKKMTVEIPDKLYRLTIDSNSGDVNSEVLSVEHFTISSKCGDFKGSFKNTKTIDFDLMAGDIELSCSSPNLDLNCHTTCGDLDLDLDGLHTARFVTDAGDIDMKLHSPFEKITIDTSCGDIKVDSKELSGVNLIARTTMGDVVNRAPSCDKGNMIVVDSSVGDIKII